MKIRMKNKKGKKFKKFRFENLLNKISFLKVKRTKDAPRV
tara:strand:- start:242 stop:361 length:120 start_codon:yes stop_codon:yes gene_type:complete